MAIQILQQPASVSFYRDPILLKARTSITDKTFAQLRVSCNIRVLRGQSEYPHAFLYNSAVDSSGSVSVNLSMTLRAAIDEHLRYEVSTSGTVQQSIYKAIYTLTVTEYYLENNEEIKGDEVVLSNSFTALPGGLTDYERLTASNGDTSQLIGGLRILSRKPDNEIVSATEPIVVPVVSSAGGTVKCTLTRGEVILHTASSSANSYEPVSLTLSTSTIAPESAINLNVIGNSKSFTRKIYVRPSEPNSVHFLFVNSFGAIESVNALTHPSLSYKTESTLYEVPRDASYRGLSEVIGMTDPAYGTLLLSSGYVSREWGEWWMHEFLSSRKVWMKAEGLYVPVTVAPSDDVEMYDRANPSLVSVSFSVRYAFSGGLLNRFNR